MLGLLNRFWSCVMNVAALTAVGRVLEQHILRLRSSGCTRGMVQVVRAIGDRLLGVLPSDAASDRTMTACEMDAGKVCSRIAGATMDYMANLPIWAAVHSQVRNFHLRKPYESCDWWLAHEDPKIEDLISPTPFAIASAAALDFARTLLSDVMTSCPGVSAKIIPRFGFFEAAESYSVRLFVCIEFFAEGRRITARRMAVSSSVDLRILRIHESAKKRVRTATHEASEMKHEVGGGCGR